MSENVRFVKVEIPFTEEQCEKAEAIIEKIREQDREYDSTPEGLLAHLVLWGSKHELDRKLIAFEKNVNAKNAMLEQETTMV